MAAPECHSMASHQVSGHILPHLAGLAPSVPAGRPRPVEPPAELLGRLVAERAVGPFPIVVLPPGLHDLPRIRQAQEPVLVETFVAQPTVEALAVGVLDRLARIDEVQA